VIACAKEIAALKTHLLFSEKVYGFWQLLKRPTEGLRVTRSLKAVNSLKQRTAFIANLAFVELRVLKGRMTGFK